PLDAPEQRCAAPRGCRGDRRRRGERRRQQGDSRREPWGARRDPPAQAATGAFARPLSIPLPNPSRAWGSSRGRRGPRRPTCRANLSRSVLTLRRVVGVSAQDAALSITFWALLHSVPTSLAITIAAAAARVPITASAMPYSARSWPASSTIKFFISAVMLSSLCRSRVQARSDPDASHPAPSPSAQDNAADQAAVKKIMSFGIIAAPPTGAPVTPGARRGRRAMDLRGPQQKRVGQSRCPFDRWP